jgi:hypothetical protein
MLSSQELYRQITGINFRVSRRIFDAIFVQTGEKA